MGQPVKNPLSPAVLPKIFQPLLWDHSALALVLHQWLEPAPLESLSSSYVLRTIPWNLRTANTQSSYLSSSNALKIHPSTGVCWEVVFLKGCSHWNWANALITAEVLMWAFLHQQQHRHTESSLPPRNPTEVRQSESVKSFWQEGGSFQTSFVKPSALCWYLSGHLYTQNERYPCK